jgi:hypothetical protein
MAEMAGLDPQRVRRRSSSVQRKSQEDAVVASAKRQNREMKRTSIAKIHSLGGAETSNSKSPDNDRLKSLGGICHKSQKNRLAMEDPVA